MTPHDPYRFESTDARPALPGLVKLALIIGLAAVGIVTKLAGGW